MRSYLHDSTRDPQMSLLGRTMLADHRLKLARLALHYHGESSDPQSHATRLRRY